MFGYKGQDVAVLFTQEDRAAGIPDQKINTAIETGLSIDERWHLHKAGNLFFASGTTSPLKDDEGNITGLINIIRNITERREAEVKRAAV